jgi:hypothetical protein
MPANVYNQIELTKNNHLQYWFNNDTEQHWRTHPYDTACCMVGQGWEPQYKGFHESLDTTVKHFYSLHGASFLMFLSGGLDSEVATRFFYKNSLPISPLIVRFAHNLNKEDVDNALWICQDLKFSPTVYDFDPVAFFHGGEWRRIAEDYQCYSFYQQMLLYIAETLGKPLITVDEIEIQKVDDNWFFVKKEDQDGCWHRFVERTGIPAYNNFYTFDPETIWAFMQNNTVQELINDKIPGKLGWTSSKHKIYSELTGFPLKNRAKRHGMEKMMHVWDYVLEKSASILHESPQCFLFDARTVTQLDQQDGMVCKTSA